MAHWNLFYNVVNFIVIFIADDDSVAADAVAAVVVVATQMNPTISSIDLYICDNVYAVGLIGGLASK